MFMPSFCIKLIELGIATACLVLQQYSYDLTDVSTLILCSGTYVGFILVLSGELIGEMVFAPLDVIQDVYFSVLEEWPCFGREMVFAPLDVIQDVYFSVLGMAMFGTCGWILYTARTDPERNPRTDDTFVAYAAGLAAINVLLMFCELLSEKQDPFMEAWWSGAGAVLYGACGARTLQGWRHVPDSPRRDCARATAICALAATSVLIVDAIRVLCADDGSSIASSYDKKPSKSKAPKLGLDLTSSRSPICMTGWSPIRFSPAKVPINEVPLTGGLDMGTRVTGGAPKLTPEKLTLKKFPMACRPLSLGPKVNRSFW